MCIANHGFASIYLFIWVWLIIYKWIWDKFNTRYILIRALWFSTFLATSFITSLGVRLSAKVLVQLTWLLYYSTSFQTWHNDDATTFVLFRKIHLQLPLLAKMVKTDSQIVTKSKYGRPPLKEFCQNIANIF